MLRLMSVSLLLFAASWTGVAQSRVISAGIASWDGGLVVQYESRLATPAQARYLEGWTTGGTFTHDGVTRYFVDGKRGIYFGYELVIEYSDEAQLMLLKGIRKYQVKFKPLNLKPEAVRGHFNGAEPVAVKLQSYPEARMVGNGDEISFDIVPEGGRQDTRIAESIRFTWHPPRMAPAGGGEQ